MFESRSDNTQNQQVYEQAQVNARSTKFLSKVFGHFSLYLLISTALAVGLGILFSYLLGKAIAAGDDVYTSKIGLTLLILLGVSALGVLITSIIAHVRGFIGTRSTLVPAILYSVFMGILLSSLVIFINWFYLALAFGVTTLIFAILYLIGKVVKVNLPLVAILAMTLFIGGALMSLGFFLFYLIAPTLFSWLYVAISAILLFVVILFTGIDIWRIQRIADSGSGNPNLSQYCAFILYVDFIYMFMRVLVILLRVFGNRK